MRFYEFAQPKRQVLSTNRLDRDFRGHERQISPKFFEFIEFRRVALPQDGFSKKDAPFTGANLTGWRHVHLVHGKIILIYRIDGQSLLLACIVTHKDTEGNSPLIGYLTGLGSGDFHEFPFMPDDAGPEGLSAEQNAAVEELIYEYAASHRDVLEAFVRGRTDREFAEMLCMSVDLPFDREGFETVLDGFGGRPGLAQKILAILKRTA